MILFTACQREENPQRNEYVLSGVLIADDTLHHVDLAEVLGFDIPPYVQAIQNATVTAYAGGGSFALNADPEIPGAYQISSEELPLTHGDIVEIEAIIGEHSLSGKVVLPPPISIESISTQNVLIDPSSPGMPVIDLEWTSVGGALYVMRLDTVPGEHELIPYSGGGNFDLYFGLPLTNELQSIWDTDFAFTGLHRLTIFAIDPDYEQVFLYPAQGDGADIQSSPDNIENGSGYLTGVSRVSITLNVEAE